MPSEQQPITFRCRPSPKATLLRCLFFGACAAVIGQEASTNTKGLILNGIIEFSPSSASVFYWVLALLSALFVLEGGWTLLTTFIQGVPDVVLTDDAISFPVGFPIKRAFSLPYSQVTELSQREFRRQRFLILHTATKQHHIFMNWLGSRDAEAALLQALAQRLAAVSTKPQA